MVSITFGLLWFLIHQVYYHCSSTRIITPLYYGPRLLLHQIAFIADLCKVTIKPIEFVDGSRFIMAIKLLQPVYYGRYYIALLMVSVAEKFYIMVIMLNSLWLLA